MTYATEDDEPNPVCDICGVEQYASEYLEWNGETGNHVICEEAMDDDVA